MNSQISRILACMVMDQLLDHCVKNFLSSTVLFKYVDDLIATIPGSMVVSTLGIFNGFHCSIQLVVEREISTL